MERKAIEAVLKPSPAYTKIANMGCVISVLLYCLGLYNAELLMSEKGFYLLALAMMIYSTINVQKGLRDELEGMETSVAHKSLNKIMLALSASVFLFGLYNADTLMLNEKGFFFMAFTMSALSAVVIQKNVRDIQYINTLYPRGTEAAANPKAMDLKKDP